MEINKLFTDSEWEKKFSYSRAVRIGNNILFSGTVASDNSGECVGIGDVAIQTKFILLKIEDSLKKMNCSKNDIYQTRMYVTDISNSEIIGKVHGEFFEGINPITTMVEVSKLIKPEYLIEIEVKALSAK